MELISEKGYRSSMDGEVVPFLQKDRYSGQKYTCPFGPLKYHVPDGGQDF